MPLESIHKLAFKAAEATHCAGEQGQFWEMSHRLFEQQKALEPWKAHAEALDLDVPRFEECMTSGRFAAVIRKDMAEAQKAGITGTPAFVLAVTDPAANGVPVLYAARYTGDAQLKTAAQRMLDYLLTTAPRTVLIRRRWKNPVM
jgi:protein-disulfide isomerase